jgi:aryl-alcohol dehydrogenase-like predicted oxidoreductase
MELKTMTQKISIPETDLVVHPLCLGGNVFGWSADGAQSFAILDAYVEAGGNFIDTADVYSEWKPGNKGGESETIIGNWMKSRGNRSEMVIATKVAKLSTRPGLSPENISAALEDSLRRLQTDYIDLYYSHEDDAKTPMEQTLLRYTELISVGKIRYIGASQHTGARLADALELSKRDGYAAYVALQDQYNLVERNPFESEQEEVVRSYGISAIPFFGLAKGFLSGKYRPGVAVDSVRADGVLSYQNEKGWALIELLDQLSRKYGSSISAISLAWLRSNPAVSTPIASARTVEQLREIVQIVELEDADIDALDRASA